MEQAWIFFVKNFSGYTINKVFIRSSIHMIYRCLNNIFSVFAIGDKIIEEYVGKKEFGCLLVSDRFGTQYGKYK